VARPIENSRNHCAFIGALQTLQAVGGIVPIVHSTAGCGIQQYLGGCKAGGWGGSGYAGGEALPSSNVMEKQIIFGGSSRLREQIKNTVKVMQADLYAVLPGCATELVGDDISAMVKEARDQDFPVAYIPAPGFKGDIHTGYELAVKALIGQLCGLTSTAADKIPGSVNVLGIIPGQDVFWQGHLLELQELLTQAGLSVNTLFGFGQTVQDWKKVSRAELNLTFSPWGTRIARHLQEEFGTPCLELNQLPVGAESTGRFLQRLQETLELDGRRVAALQTTEEQRLSYYLNQLADVYFEYDFQKEFALVGEAGLVFGLVHFLSKSAGLIPRTLVITDNLNEFEQKSFDGQIKQLAADFGTDVVFHEDQEQINEALRKNSVELILGSSLEQEIASELRVPLLPVAFPLTGTAILSRSYAGFRGAAAFLEDLSGAVLQFAEAGRR
jgi:nitrogenase molybdenum-iron protein beta chain